METVLSSGEILRHTTYNWNMDPVAGAADAGDLAVLDDVDAAAVGAPDGGDEPDAMTDKQPPEAAADAETIESLPPVEAAMSTMTAPGCTMTRLPSVTP